eukprot:CAMPEP_0197467240 /NCGR_PEP_ID=MMETSP1175-20131217/65465_1 /TAXON_ID=1003142 /ORGANISM="Triceratium dubium, Strain CCMP147" /LENGTH=188 /DNA_ID=CAMNT_0043003303 /DNA_START=286 /DNA_END=848 /DNA_ORIENTATION=-
MIFDMKSVATLLVLLTAAAMTAPASRADFGIVAPVRMSAPPAVEEEVEEAMSELDEEILFGDSFPGSSSNVAKDPPYPGRHRKKSKSGALLPDRTLPKSLSTLDHSTSNPLVNKLRTMRDTATTCPGLWKDLAEHNPDGIAVIDNHLCDTKIKYTNKQMEERVRRSAAVFRDLGVKRGTKVAVLGENS